MQFRSPTLSWPPSQNKTKNHTLYHMFQCSQATDTTLDILKLYIQKGENNS